MPPAIKKEPVGRRKTRASPDSTMNVKKESSRSQESQMQKQPVKQEAQTQSHSVKQEALSQSQFKFARSTDNTSIRASSSPPRADLASLKLGKHTQPKPLNQTSEASLMSLTPELRTRIYSNLFSSTIVHIGRKSRTTFPDLHSSAGVPHAMTWTPSTGRESAYVYYTRSHNTGILATCKTIRVEAQPLIFTNATFQCFRDQLTLRMWLDVIPRTYLPLLREVRIRGPVRFEGNVRGARGPYRDLKDLEDLLKRDGFDARKGLLKVKKRGKWMSIKDIEDVQEDARRDEY